MFIINFPAANDSKAVVQDLDNTKKQKKKFSGEKLKNGIEMDALSTSKSTNSANVTLKEGMVLPFQPLSLAFNHINYYVDTPSVSPPFYHNYLVHHKK